MSSIEFLPKDLHRYLYVFTKFAIKTPDVVAKLSESELRWLSLYHYVYSLIKTSEVDNYMIVFPAHGITTIDLLIEKGEKELRNIGLKPFHAKKLIKEGHRVDGSMYEDVKYYQQFQRGSLKETLRLNIGAVFVPSK